MNRPTKYNFALLKRIAHAKRNSARRSPFFIFKNQSQFITFSPQFHYKNFRSSPFQNRSSSSCALPKHSHHSRVHPYQSQHQNPNQTPTSSCQNQDITSKVPSPHESLQENSRKMPQPSSPVGASTASHAARLAGTDMAVTGNITEHPLPPQDHIPQIHLPHKKNYSSEICQPTSNKASQGNNRVSLPSFFSSSTAKMRRKISSLDLLPVMSHAQASCGSGQSFESLLLPSSPSQAPSLS